MQKITFIPDTPSLIRLSMENVSKRKNKDRIHTKTERQKDDIKTKIVSRKKKQSQRDI